MIKRVGLITPYRRLVFGLSAADVLQSFALITGPFASPVGGGSSRFTPWAAGNTATCNTDGFLLIYGSTAVPMYLLCLSYYYVCKLPRKMSNATFTRRFEKKAHCFINILMLSICLTGLFTKNINSMPSGGGCYFSRYPLGCGTYPEVVGECTRGLQTMTFVYITAIGVQSICFLGTIGMMVWLVRDAIATERMHSTIFRDPERPSQQTSCLAFLRCCCCWCKVAFQEADESDADYILRLYRRETIIQALLYVITFFMTYIVVFSVMVGGILLYIFPSWLGAITAVTFPVMGMFNILIYTRPKVQRLRCSYPEISWIRSFLLVVKAGGEVPDVANDPHALRISCCWHANGDIPPSALDSINPPLSMFLAGTSFEMD
jgi:hypothetical protein